MKLKKLFTLIELLVVIAIISILSALLLPSLNKARTMAKGTACLSQQKQLAICNFSYANDFSDFPVQCPTNTGSGAYFTYAEGSVNNPWHMQGSEEVTKHYTSQPSATAASPLAPYGSSALALCPSWDKARQTTDTDWTPMTSAQMPSVTSSGAAYWTSYAYSGSLFLTSSGWGYAPGYYKMSRFPSPSKTVQCIDFRPWHSGVSVWNYRTSTNWTSNSNLRFNAAFLDGHASPVRTNDFVATPIDYLVLNSWTYNRHLR